MLDSCDEIFPAEPVQFELDTWIGVSACEEEQRKKLEVGAITLRVRCILVSRESLGRTLPHAESSKCRRKKG